MGGVSNPVASLSLDLSRLPAPAVVAQPSFEALLAERTADFQRRAPGHDALVESDPALKLLEAGAYREFLARAAINDAARAVMPAYATGTDLDNLAALYGLTRLVLTPATDTTPAVREGDADLRARLQLAPEQFANPGLTAGSYRSLALRTAPEVKDVAVVKRGAGRIDIVLLGRAGDGSVSPAIVTRVARAFQGEDETQLTDIVSVRSAAVVPYAVNVRLLIRNGPDPATVTAAADASVRAYAADRHRVGYTVYAQMIAAAASVGGVEQAIVDVTDIVPGPAGAAFLTGLTITPQVLA